MHNYLDLTKILKCLRCDIVNVWIPLVVSQSRLFSTFQRLDLVRGAFTWHCCTVCRYVTVVILYVWIICRKEKAIMWWSKYTYWFIKKKILFNWFDLFFFLASRWITHDLWSSVSSLFRVSRLDMDYCCMLKKTYLWSGFLIANKTFQIFFILNTCSMTVIENHWKIMIEKLVIIWD